MISGVRKSVDGSIIDHTIAETMSLSLSPQQEVQIHLVAHIIEPLMHLGKDKDQERNHLLLKLGEMQEVIEKRISNKGNKKC